MWLSSVADSRAVGCECECEDCDAPALWMLLKILPIMVMVGACRHQNTRLSSYWGSRNRKYRGRGRCRLRDSPWQDRRLSVNACVEHRASPPLVVSDVTRSVVCAQSHEQAARYERKEPSRAGCDEGEGEEEGRVLWI